MRINCKYWEKLSVRTSKSTISIKKTNNTNMVDSIFKTDFSAIIYAQDHYIPWVMISKGCWMRSSRVQQYKLCVIRMTQQVPDGFLPYFVTWYDDVMKKKKDWTSLILHHGNVVFGHVCVCCLAAGQRRNRARDVHGYTCGKTSWGNESEPRWLRLKIFQKVNTQDNMTWRTN